MINLPPRNAVLRRHLVEWFPSNTQTQQLTDVVDSIFNDLLDGNIYLDIAINCAIVEVVLNYVNAPPLLQGC